MSANAVRSLVIVGTWLLASSAAAQRSRPALPPTAPAPPRPSAPARSPRITLPLPNLMPPIAGGLTGPVPFTPPSITSPPRDLFRLPPGRPFATPAPGCVGFSCGAYLASVPQLMPNEPIAGAEISTGLLRLDGTPADAQVFIDGAFVGALKDVEAQRVLTLPEGVHRVEIRATDREPATVDVRIAAHETVTYHVSLEPTRPRVEPPRPPQSSAPQHMYVIPNCYIGNVPPRASRLPAGCDIKHVQVL